MRRMLETLGIFLLKKAGWRWKLIQVEGNFNHYIDGDLVFKRTRSKQIIHDWVFQR